MWDELLVDQSESEGFSPGTPVSLPLQNLYTHS